MSLPSGLIRAMIFAPKFRLPHPLDSDTAFTHSISTFSAFLLIITDKAHGTAFY